MTKFISNSEFKYLNVEERARLKDKYTNYLYKNNVYYHYIQDTNEYYFNKHLSEIEQMHLGNVTIYINDKYGRDMMILRDDECTSLPLF